MTDETPSLPNDEPQASDGAETPKSSDAKSDKEVPPGMLPLVDPVFGDGVSWKAFLITAVPFIVYLAGTGLGAHLEDLRKTEPAHTMRGTCRSLLQEIKPVIAKLPPEQITEMNERLDIENLSTALDDESSEIGDLIQQCDKLLNGNFDDLVQPLSGQVQNLKDHVQHFFELEALIEEGDVDEVRNAYTEFLQSKNPDEEVGLKGTWYPLLYSVACIASLIVILFAMRGYLTQPFRVTPLALGVGVLGIFVWLGLWWLDKNVLGIGSYFAPHSRAGFNPFVELKANPTWMYTFLGIRLLGLCLVIPIAEEFFARGFLMRYIEDIDWDQIEIGATTWKGLVGILVYGAMTHPGEIVAALAWFGLVTWLFLRTKNIWDCVVAHSVTNTLLAVYVLTTKTWELW